MAVSPGQRLKGRVVSFVTYGVLDEPAKLSESMRTPSAPAFVMSTVKPVWVSAGRETSVVVSEKSKSFTEPVTSSSMSPSQSSSRPLHTASSAAGVTSPSQEPKVPAVQVEMPPWQTPTPSVPAGPV